MLITELYKILPVWDSFYVDFAVKSFENAVPDEIYVRAGETVSYDFDVPVSVVLKQTVRRYLNI